MIKRRRITAILLTVLFVIAVALSFDFALENREHECSDNACPVCAMLEIAEQLSGGTKKLVAVSSLFIFSISALIVLYKVLGGNFTAVTPISLFDILID